jgi:sulfite reductase beta subunit-like hemoprotein
LEEFLLDQSKFVGKCPFSNRPRRASLGLVVVGTDQKSYHHSYELRVWFGDGKKRERGTKIYLEKVPARQVADQRFDTIHATLASGNYSIIFHGRIKETRLVLTHESQ